MPRLPRLREIVPESEGWGYFLCTSKELRPIRSGELLLFTLQDATGQMQAKLLEDIERFKDEFETGEFVRVEAHGTTFQGQTQLVVSHVRRVNPPQDRLQGFREEDCVLSAPRSADEMWRELSAHLQNVRDPHIRVLLNRITADHERELKEWPAAQQVHHAYRGGLLEHILKMAEAGLPLARAYGASEDLVLAGVVLHDIGKLEELSYEPGAIGYTRDGNLIGHVALGLMRVRETTAAISGFPGDLRAQIEHIIVSHHGTREHGAPVEPKTIEAFIVAAVDELDSRISQVRRAIREDTGTDLEFTVWHRRLGRVLFKGGWGG
jgi:3'-5' exoribonuclease